GEDSRAGERRGVTAGVKGEKRGLRRCRDRPLWRERQLGRASQSGIEAEAVSESPTHWRQGGPAPGGPGGWGPERGPNPGAVAVARGGTLPANQVRELSHPCDGASEPSGRSSRGGEYTDSIDCSPRTLERHRDFVVKTDLPLDHS